MHMTFKFIFPLLLSSAFVFSHAATITGRVVGVADGDTVTVLDSANTQQA
jgi:endonuclease YncB( thermonuclease family)